VAARRQQEQASRAHVTARCVTKRQNGEKCEMRVFQCYGNWLRAASSRGTGTGNSGLSELALLFSARSTVCLAAVLTCQKMARNAKYACFDAMALGRARQAAGEILTGKVGLPELAPLLST